MKVFTVHMRRQGLDPHKDIVFVREGFSWWAFAFTFMWAAYHRLWLMMVATAIIVLAMGIGMPYLGSNNFLTAVVQTGFAAMVGYVAHDVRRHSLARNGFAELDVVVAKDQTSAEQRFFDQNPDMAHLIEADG
jgi:hypothetical protein